VSLKDRADRLAQEMVQAREILEEFNRSAIYDLLRRAQYGMKPDGYPPSTRPTEIRGQDDDPLLATALARIEHQETDDFLKQQLKEIFGTMSEISGHCKRIHRMRSVVINAGAKLKNRQSTLSQCQCCERDVLNTPDDRIVSGYCGACLKAWDRAGRPDRLPFEINRRNELKAKRAAATTT